MIRSALLASTLLLSAPAFAQERPPLSFAGGPELSWDSYAYTPYSWYWKGDNHFPGSSLCVGGQAIALIGIPRVGVDGRWCFDPWYAQIAQTWSVGGHVGALVPVRGGGSGGDIGVGFQQFTSNQRGTFVGDYVYVRFAFRYVLPFDFLSLEFAGTWQMNFPTSQTVQDEAVAFGSYFQPGLRISVLFGRLASMAPPPAAPPPEVPEPVPEPDEPPPLAVPVPR